jgi:hypothetical protein
MSTRVFAIGDFIRRVVESLLHGGGRGRFLCARCLVKLAKNHLDKSYTTREVAQAMEDVFSAAGPVMHVMASSICAVCARKGVACLGVPSR